MAFGLFDTGSNSFSGLNQPRSLTESEKDLLPYIQSQKEKTKEDFNLFTPLEVIFDILSRGQYASANLGEDLTRALRGEDVNLIGALWEGLTGKRKGDWKTTFFGGQDKGESSKFSGIFENAPEWTKASLDVPLLGKVNTQDVIGFLGNVLLDPTTYLSFGATKAGKKAAQAYSEIAVKGALKQASNLDEIGKFAKAGFDKVRFNDLLEKNADSAVNYLSQFAGKKDMAKFINKVAVDAKKQALKMTAREAQAQLVKGIIKNKDQFLQQAAESLARGKHQKNIKFLEQAFGDIEAKKGLGSLIDYQDSLKVLKDPNITTDQAKAVYQRLLGGADEGLFKGIEDPRGIGRAFSTVNDYTREVERMYSDEFLQQFKGMGERSVLNLFGNELGKYQFKPNSISRTYDAFMDKIAGSKLGEKFSDAVWTILNDDKSPVAWIRRAFGIRNPYQKILRVKEMNSNYLFREEAKRQLDEVTGIFQGVDKDISQKVRDVMIHFEGKNPEELLSPDILKQFGIKPDQVDQVRKLLSGVKEYTNKLNTIEQGLIDQGLLDKYTARSNYLPIIEHSGNRTGRPRPGGTLGPGFTKHKDFSMAERVAMDKEKIKFLLGVDDATAEILILEKNWGTLNMDLEEMLMHRGLAHAQAVKHADFIKEFREFGVNFGVNQVKYSNVFDNIPDVEAKKSPELMAALKMQNMRLDELGLTSVKAPGFEGYLFDKDVARIIDRVNPTIGSDAGMKRFNELTSYASSLWRASATLSPGFHLRNAKSNLFTLYIKDGAKALNPQRAFESFIGSVYALEGESGLKNLKIPEKTANSILGKKIGNKSIKDWAEFARMRGVISNTTMGFDFNMTVKSQTQTPKISQKLNPFNLDNALFSASKKFGAVVESSPKFASFLNDIENMAKYGDFSDSASNFAVGEAKKWFFDYEDLTDFEKNTMKKVIPFYTWIRKNLALQLTEISEKKGMYSQFAKLNNLQWDDETNPEDIPAWTRQEGYIPIGEGEDGKTRFVDPGLPYADVNILPFKFEIVNGIPIPKLSIGDAWDNFISMSDPAIKTVVGLTPEQGWDSFRKKDLSSNSPAPRAMRLIATNPKLLEILDSAIKATGYEKGLNAQKDKEGRLTIDGKIEYLLETNFLLLKRLDQAGSGISQLFPQIESAIESTTGFKDMYQGTEKLFQNMSFWLGIKQKDIDLDQEQSFRFRKILEEAEKKRSEERKRQPGYQRVLDKYIRSNNARMQRLGLK